MSNYPPEKAVQQQQNPYGQGYNGGVPAAYEQGFPRPAGAYPGAAPGPPTEFMDPTVPRPNDILPLHPAIIQQRQIAASLPPCSKGGYHELRTHLALGANTGTFLSIVFFPVMCCFVRDETVCIKCNEKFNVVLPRIR
ncbi:hypothetical protein B0O80DRAFT_500399 [Mortierella sp. GBAus27b]|nr:hypothetical protein BGX31_004787 [Mortierella sp. GBA43]KAI8351070.1 hypothetical protein B0O80DRAFT_500399 [Mortierella sp. GBAus27b]